MEKFTLSMAFNTTEPLEQVNEISRIHNCARTDTVMTLLAMYDADAFSKQLPKTIEKRKQEKKILIEESKRKRRETQELAALLNKNPELLERLRKELANDD
jgi:hypothetical protein